VYLDLGKFGGLAETMDESIRYPIRTPRDGDEMAPCVLAGPTCDSADVLYERQPYALPVSLEIGDKVLIEGNWRVHVDLRRRRLQRLLAAEDHSHLIALSQERIPPHNPSGESRRDRERARTRS